LIVYKAVLSDLSDLAQSLEGDVPKFEHFISDTKFVKSLAARHLMDSAKRDNVSKVSVELYNAIREATSWKATNRMVIPPGLVKFEAEALEFAQSPFDHATKAALVIAGCNVLLELSGKERVDGAAKLLATRREQIPKALVAELDCIAITVKPEPKSAATSKSKATLSADATCIDVDGPPEKRARARP
jgi:hypothetical protein